MSSVPKEKERSQLARPGDNGRPTFNWQLSDTRLRDTVKLVLPPTDTLPVIFVPGIMGSNLMDKEKNAVWRLDGFWTIPANLALKWIGENAGKRQAVLHPARTHLDPRGAVPDEPVGTIHDKKTFTTRGWGEVGELSYHSFLIALEQKLNGESFNPAKWDDFFYTAVSATPAPGAPRPEPKLSPGITMTMQGLPVFAEDRHMTDAVLSDELLARAKWRFPVYACGYNWLDSNQVAAERLQTRINQIIAENNKGSFHCKQVILVTHSMGGLVARACALLPGMQDKIAGITHGVMPAVGAPVAYRRCKIGMQDEDFKASLVIGKTGREVTAIFAQAPGALQLLPSQDYKKGWLHLKDPQGKAMQSLPVSDPYSEIYLCKDKWWGLVQEEWLSPKEGIPIKWNVFTKNIKDAKEFHLSISGKYHPHTYVYYGADSKFASFETVRWSMSRGVQPGGTAPKTEKVQDLSHTEVREDGSNPIYVGGKTNYQTGYGAGGGYTTVWESSFWTLTCDKQDGAGDGTVPLSSGCAPRTGGGNNIRQQFKLTGFDHEKSYKNKTAQQVTLYAITKIAAHAKKPT